MIIINNSFVYMEASYLKKKKDKITIRSSTEEYFERLLELIREIRFLQIDNEFHRLIFECTGKIK